MHIAWDLSWLGANLTFLPLAWLTYSSIFWARGRVNTRPHNVCERLFAWAQASLQLPERHIKVNRGTQEPPGFKGLWQSRHQIWESWYRHHACTQKAVASSMSCSLQTFCWGCRSHCRLWQCFGQGLSLKNICTASAKSICDWSLHCHHDQSPLCVWYESKHFCFPQPWRCREWCREVKLASFFGFVCVPLCSS